jgi:prepilin-type N-terminal cleavage/methylation domain-containing protein
MRCSSTCLRNHECRLRDSLIPPQHVTSSCGRPQDRSRRLWLVSAFTLIELLIVVSILAVLSTLGFVFARGAIEKAREGECISNLRQIGVAFHQFAADHNGRFPGHMLNAGGQSSNDITQIGAIVNRHVPEHLASSGYITDQRVWFCPGQKYYTNKPTPSWASRFNDQGWQRVPSGGPIAATPYVGYNFLTLRSASSLGVPGGGLPSHVINGRVTDNPKLTLVMDFTPPLSQAQSMSSHGNRVNVLRLSGQVITCDLAELQPVGNWRLTAEKILAK